MCINETMCVVSGQVSPSVLVDESVRIERVVGEDTSVGDCGGGGEKTGDVSGDRSVKCGEKVVLANKDEADALSALRNVNVCMLFVEYDVIVHDSCGLMNVCNEISVVKKGENVFEDDKRWAKEKDEFDYGMQKVAWVLRSPSLP